MLSSFLIHDVEHALAEYEGGSVTIERILSCGGGCINHAAKLLTSTGRSYFLKWNHDAPPTFFIREMEGLRELRACGVLRVPEAIAASDTTEQTPAWLLLEDVTAPTPGNERAAQTQFSETLGRGLALIHQRHASQFGFHADNFIGSTPQPNPWCSSWPEFFREWRLGHMIRLLTGQGRLSHDQIKLSTRFLNKLDELLSAVVEPPSLLHGDLWGGNVMSDANGSPTLIDPAVYYGHREADLAMTELFGGFDARFYAAYREAYPLDTEYRDRRDIYNLYHILNHALLFGSSYLLQAERIMRHYVG
ncbi:MAG: fructosamine kinase [Candidatus Sumerlaea sp.]|nr:MAG: fructosamine kinase [Candidatus Sumerlaea sp.]